MVRDALRWGSRPRQRSRKAQFQELASPFASPPSISFSSRVFQVFGRSELPHSPSETACVNNRGLSLNHKSQSPSLSEVLQRTQIRNGQSNRGNSRRHRRPENKRSHRQARSRWRRPAGKPIRTGGAKSLSPNTASPKDGFLTPRPHAKPTTLFRPRACITCVRASFAGQPRFDAKSRLPKRETGRSVGAARAASETEFVPATRIVERICVEVSPPLGVLPHLKLEFFAGWVSLT